MSQHAHRGAVNQAGYPRPVCCIDDVANPLHVYIVINSVRLIGLPEKGGNMKYPPNAIHGLVQRFFFANVGYARFNQGVRKVFELGAFPGHGSYPVASSGKLANNFRAYKSGGPCY